MQRESQPEIFIKALEITKIPTICGQSKSRRTKSATFFSLYRKFLKSSEIVYNRLEIKNDIAKERRGLRHDVVYEVFCFGLG